MSADFRLEWKGDEVKRRMQEAELKGVDRTLDAAVAHAKSSHPGWRNVTGRTEASIKKERPKREGEGVVGRFGSDEPHFVFLEVGFRGRSGDHTLRRASDTEGGHMADRIRDAYK